jgi:catechol 2,3-dioxygenase-like lactoylglutathione lyase family enzyme
VAGVNPTRIDHVVLYAADVDETAAFYERVGMARETFADGRVAVTFGDAKINLHPAGDEYVPHARAPSSGAADFCLVVDDDAATVAAHLDDEGIEVVEGPVEKTGALGSMTSVYVHDPDGNLVEFASYE